LWSQMLLLLLLFLVAVSYHARLVEVTARLDFLWAQAAGRELDEMADTRRSNAALLTNILPGHVAAHFLNEEARRTDALYSQARDSVAVMFASIPSFTHFYSEDINKGMECIRLLNEIIVDFDELLDEPRFNSCEKVKFTSKVNFLSISMSYVSISRVKQLFKFKFSVINLGKLHTILYEKVILI
jgi:adenylate cyclase 8